MQTSEFDAGLARQKRRALMCTEAVPWRCHRSLIADALTVLEIPISPSGRRSKRYSTNRFPSFLSEPGARHPSISPSLALIECKLSDRNTKQLRTEQAPGRICAANEVTVKNSWREVAQHRSRFTPVLVRLARRDRRPKPAQPQSQQQLGYTGLRP